MSSGRTWERQDPAADSYLIDPGPDPSLKVTRREQRQMREALDKSKPGSMRKGIPDGA